MYSVSLYICIFYDYETDHENSILLIFFTDFCFEYHKIIIITRMRVNNINVCHVIFKIKVVSFSFMVSDTG